MLRPFPLPLRMLRLLVPALAATALAVAGPTRADVLDQAFAGEGTAASVDVNASFSRAQTFTVGITGTLTRIALVLASSSTTALDELTIDVRPTDESGVPLTDAAAAFGSRTIAGDVLGSTLDPNAPTELDFTSFAIPVAAGQRLAIVARSNVPFASGRQFAWGARLVESAGYDAGEAWLGAPGWSLQNGGGVDLEFETYVEVPEPAGAAAAALGALLVLCARRRG